MSGNITPLPGLVAINEFTEVDDERWILTGCLLDNPASYRRLVRTQVEELYALYRHYPLPELDGIKQILEHLQQAYNNAEPFNRTLRANWDRYPWDEREDEEESEKPNG
jgi:hypothetical protein